MQFRWNKVTPLIFTLFTTPLAQQREKCKFKTLIKLHNLTNEYSYAIQRLPA